MTATAVRWWRIVVAIGLLNFGAFVVGALAIGGDAVNGRRVGDRYFVAEHGRMTQVSRAVWLYSRVHAYSVWITHPLAVLGMFVLSGVRRRP